MKSFSSSKVIPSTSLLNRSRMSRMVWTASNSFLGLFIREDLPWASDLKQGITLPKVHRIITSNARQINDVAEIPTDQHIHAADRGDGNMLGVDPLSATDHPFIQVTLGQFPGLRGEI